MPLRPTLSALLLPMRAPERSYPRVTSWRRSLCVAIVALLAGCSRGNVAPAAPSVVASAAATVPVATTPVAPAPAPRCGSNDDCVANHAGALCMPKPMTKEQSDAEDFLARAMSLHDLITRLSDASSASPMTAILRQVHEDQSTYSQIAQGRVPSGADASPAAQGALTRKQMQQMQDAAWMHSGAAQADVTIRQFSQRLSTSPITTDAQTVYADINGDGTGLQVDKLINDLRTFLQDVEVAVAPVNTLVGYGIGDGGVPDLQTGAGAVLHYLGPTLVVIRDAVSRVTVLLDPSAISKLRNDLTLLSRQHGLLGKDGNLGTCLESPRDAPAAH